MAVHLSGKHDIVSDAGSQDSLFATRWNDYPFRDAVLKHSVTNDIVQKCGPFDVDLFANRAGIGAQAAAWFPPEHTVFEPSSTARKVWAHPPRAVAARALPWLESLFRSG
eukprot:3154907-Pyramimonas_sp.AAC.1